MAPQKQKKLKKITQKQTIIEKQINEKVKEKQINNKKKIKEIAKVEEKKDEKQVQKEQVKIIEKSKKIKKIDKKEKEQEQIEEEEIEILSYEELVKRNEKKLSEANEKVKKRIKLDKKQVKQGIEELLKYLQKTKNVKNVLDINDDLIYLEVIVNEVPDKYSIRPQEIKLRNPIYSEKYQSQFCIFSTDPQRNYKDKIQEMNIPCIAKVVGHEKLFKKYPTYLDKRRLAGEFDLFFIDHTLYSNVNKLYGKAFYQAKKIPIAINCQHVPIDKQSQFKQDYQAYLNDLSNFTYFIQGNGPVYTFKFARIDMTVDQIYQNLEDLVYQGIGCIIKENQNVDSIHQISIKTKNSISLPLVCLLSQQEIEAFHQK